MLEAQTVRRSGRQSAGRAGCLVLLVGTIVLLGAAAAFLYWTYLVPNREVEPPQFAQDVPIIVKGVVQAQGALLEGEAVKLPLTLLQELLGPDAGLRYEAAGDNEGAEQGTLILTSPTQVLRMKTAALEARLNQQPLALHVAPELQGEDVYVPQEPLEMLYGVRVDYNADSGIVALRLPGDRVQLAQGVVEEVPLRHAPGIKSAIAFMALRDDQVRIWGEEQGWYRVEGPQGHIGFVDKSHVILRGVEVIERPERKQPFIPWKLFGQRINLTWEAVYCCNPDPAAIEGLEGVNVVSPTWFELADEEGAIRSKADSRYVRWAHAEGRQVWGLFNNSFDPDLTTAALATFERREHMINQLLVFAEMYKLQGINIDFENVYTADKENLVQFMKEMTPLMHEQGLVVSIDVTPKSNSEMWSVFLDREALGRIVDYMIVMAYDEHWAASPVAGSVASLPWVERAVLRILEEDQVPPSKLILGIPLYTRVWTEQEENGEVKVSSRAIGMAAADRLLAENELVPEVDPATGQNYVEYEEDGARVRIWLEDERSVAARAALVRKYDLAGVASWARALGKASIWGLLDEELQRRP